MSTALPPSSDFTGAAVTEGDFKAALSAMRDYLSGLLGTDGAPATGLAALGAPVSGYVAKSAAYAVVAADKGKLIDCTGTWSLTALAAATAGDGFNVSVRNSGTGVITFDPNLSEAVDGGTTLAISAGESLVLYCNGTAWVTVGKASGVPSGSLVAYGGAAAPSGWLLCDGSAVSRTTYASLFTAISTTFGVGDGSSTFNIPDLRGRVVAGQDDMGGSAASRLTTAGSGVDGATVGAVGGSQTHTLTTAQLASHAHQEQVWNSDTSSVVAAYGVSGVSGTQAPIASGSVYSGATALNTAAAGSGDAHNNTQPTLVANYIIKT
jgi:microcystin-dependent protein